MSETALLEPSFADVAAAIEAATDLPQRTRSHWLCSLRQVAKMIGRPMENIAARWTAPHFAIARLHHARVAANPKTLANHKANAKAAGKQLTDAELDGVAGGKALARSIGGQVGDVAGPTG